MNDFLKSKKNIINLLILGILILALPLGINLIQKQQILKGRAVSSAEGLEFVEEEGILERRGNTFVLKEDAQGKIKLKLTSPLGPPGSITTDAGGEK